jgi:hypothetical protein
LDECGPLELRPLAGTGWFRSGHPQRFRATYYSSWLNAIEAHLTSLEKFAIGGTDDPSHEYRRWRIARYPTWRSKEKGSSKAALAQFSRVRLYRH